MPSVVGLLEQRELGARRRVDELREEADRIQAELAVEWTEWAIARSRVGEVLAPADETGQGHARADRTVPDAEGQTGMTSSAPGAAKPKSQVPVWREGLAWSALSVAAGPASGRHGRDGRGTHRPRRIRHNLVPWGGC